MWCFAQRRRWGSIVSSFLIGVSVTVFTLEVAADIGSIDLTRVRVGIHPNKTRLVVDLNGVTDFSYDIDPGVGFHVSFPDVNALKTSYRARGIVASASFDSVGTGGYLNVATKKPVEFVNVFVLPPDSYGGHRIIFDVRETGSWPVTESAMKPVGDTKTQTLQIQSNNQQIALQQDFIPASLDEKSLALWQALGLMPQTTDSMQNTLQYGSSGAVNPVPPVAPAMPVQSTIDPVTWKAMVRAQQQDNQEIDAWWQFW